VNEPTVPLILPTRQPTGEGKDALEAPARLEDGRLAERVAHALSATGYGPLRGIEVTIHEQLVILGGRVPSYHLKQVAQTTALAVSGARQVRNDLDVCRPS
jgi:osmotically-inducible protein OsmY